MHLRAATTAYFDRVAWWRARLDPRVSPCRSQRECRNARTLAADLWARKQRRLSEYPVAHAAAALGAPCAHLRRALSRSRSRQPGDEAAVGNYGGRGHAEGSRRRRRAPHAEQVQMGRIRGRVSVGWCKPCAGTRRRHARGIQDVPRPADVHRGRRRARRWPEADGDGCATAPPRAAAARADATASCTPPTCAGIPSDTDEYISKACAKVSMVRHFSCTCPHSAPHPVPLSRCLYSHAAACDASRAVAPCRFGAEITTNLRPPFPPLQPKKSKL